MPSTEKPKLRYTPKPITLTKKKIKLSIMGPIGTGKTTAAASFPKPLFIDTDDGLISVAYAAEFGTDLGECWTPEGHEDLEALYYFIRDKVRTSQYETVVIDDIGTLADLLITELTQEHAKAEPHGKRPMLMAQVPEQIEYLGTRNQIRTFLTRLSQLGVHVIVCAGDRNVAKAGEKWDIDAAPSVAKIVGKWADVQGYVMAGMEYDASIPGAAKFDGIKRLFYCQEGGIWTVKGRFSHLKPYLVIPELGEGSFYEELWGPIAERFAAAEAATAAK